MALTVFVSTLQFVLWMCMSIVIVAMIQALECKPLKPTNIECKNLKDLEPNLRAYCKGTRDDNAFWASSRHPMASAWPREYNKEIEYFQNIYSTIAKLVAQKRIDRNYRSNCPEQYRVLEDGSSNRHWYTTQMKWRQQALHHQKRIGLKQPNSNCFTQIHFDNSKSIPIMRRMRKLNDGFKKTGAKLVKSARASGSTFFQRQIGCWKNVTSPMAAPANTDALSCTVMHSVGFRRAKNGSFNVGISLTNAPIHESRKADERHYLSETWTYDKKSDIVRALPIPSYVRGNITQLRNDTTTALFTWGGNVKISYFTSIPTKEGPAMRRVNEATKHLQDNIYDGIAASNIAILMFPCLMAMIPISSFDLPSLNGRLNKIVAYSAVTDIVAVLPLLIKGIEMLYLSTKRHTICTAWSVGIEGDGLAVIELWCADCLHDQRFIVYGVVFIIVSFVFMLLGVIAEVFAFRFFSRKSSKKEKLSEKWWDRAGITPDVCLEYDCCRLHSANTSNSESFSTFDSYRFSYFTHRRNLDAKKFDTHDS